MTTLLLFCVFEIHAGSAGSIHEHVMSSNEIDHMAAIEIRADASRDPASYEIAALRAYEKRLCRLNFGRVPDLVWVQGKRI